MSRTSQQIVHEFYPDAYPQKVRELWIIVRPTGRNFIASPIANTPQETEELAWKFTAQLIT